MNGNLMWTIKQLNASIEQHTRPQSSSEKDISLTQTMILHFLFTLDSSKAYAVNLHTALGISKSSVSSTLKSLKRKGYLEIISDASDDRKKKLILTDKANRMRESIDHKLQMQQEQISREIPSEHLLWIEKDLNTMINNLKKQEQEGQSYAQNASGSGEAI